MRLIFAALGAFILASPASAQDAPQPERSQDMAWHSRQSLAIAGLKWQDGWTFLSGGVAMRLVSGNGSGVHPTVDDTVTVHYRGTFVGGEEFDSSYGGEPATFPLGKLIKGWQVAIPHMGVGDTAEIAIPAPMAYGTEARKGIPGGATLLFTVELLAVEPAAD